MPVNQVVEYQSRMSRELNAQVESQLLDLVNRLDRLREGRRAVHVHLSQLQVHNRQDHHLRIAANHFEQLMASHAGQLFQLHNSDLVFICQDASLAEIDDVVLKLRFLFSDDPLSSDGGDGGDQHFCTWYDLQRDYPEFRDLAQSMLDAVNREIADKQNAENRARADAEAAADDQRRQQAAADQPLTPAHLAQLEQAMGRMDIDAFLKSQPLCAVVPGQPPQPVFKEYFISIGDLQRIVTPGIAITSDRWLFQRLTRLLDKRVLAAMPKIDRDSDEPVSLNLNVATVLSEDFLDFDQKFRQIGHRQAVFEFQPHDVLSDMASFIFARDFLRERGYKVLIDGLDHLNFPLMKRKLLGADLVKIAWSTELAAEGDAARRNLFFNTVKKGDPSRVILCRCDDMTAVEWGMNLGISLFQGRQVDQLLQDAAKDRAEALAKKRQENSLIVAEEEAAAADAEARRKRKKRYTNAEQRLQSDILSFD